MSRVDFDTLTRMVSPVGDRRTALRLLTGGALGGILTRLGVGEAAAACAKVGKACKKSRDCCAGARCKRGRCRCEPGRGACRSRRCETDLNADEANCGGCGNACAAGETCCSGQCTRLDPPERLNNDGTSPCGCDGVICGTSGVCRNGVCVCVSRNAVCPGACGTGDCPGCCDTGICDSSGKCA